MFRLLNRIAWVLSFILGYLISLLFILFLSKVFYFNTRDIDILWVNLYPTLILAMFIKWLIFSEKYIRKQVKDDEEQGGEL